LDFWTDGLGFTPALIPNARETLYRDADPGLTVNAPVPTFVGARCTDFALPKVDLDELHKLTAAGKAANEAEAMRMLSAKQQAEMQEARKVLLDLPDRLKDAAAHGQNHLPVMRLAAAHASEPPERAPSQSPAQEMLFKAIESLGLEPSIEKISYGDPVEGRSSQDSLANYSWWVVAHWR
jgi:hypothetical protein